MNQASGRRFTSRSTLALLCLLACLIGLVASSWWRHQQALDVHEQTHAQAQRYTALIRQGMSAGDFRASTVDTDVEAVTTSLVQQSLDDLLRAAGLTEGSITQRVVSASRSALKLPQGGSLEVANVLVSLSIETIQTHSGLSLIQSLKQRFPQSRFEELRLEPVAVGPSESPHATPPRIKLAFTWRVYGSSTR
jgi:hypothetical protein